MFNLENPRRVPFWLPLLCFSLAFAIYSVGYYRFPGLEVYALIPLPLGILSLSIYLRTRKAS